MRLPRRTILLLVASLATVLATGCSGAGNMPDPQNGEAIGEVTGTVTYRQRIALPPDAVIAVTLADISRQDVVADVLAEAEIPTAGRQVPIPFRITYPTSRINPAHTYAVRARILINGVMTMTSTTIIPVLTRGAPNQVEIVVSAAGNARGDGGDAAPTQRADPDSG